LATDTVYLKNLCDAGLSCVFLQFDGLDDKCYEILRGRALLREKLTAIDNCSKAGLGVVLVPTLAQSVNMGQIGAILDFALDRLPYVRGVHFQPISYFGRYPANNCFSPDSEAARITIPDVLRAIESQTGGRMKASDFIPGGAENPYCSFHASYLLTPEEDLSLLGRPDTQWDACSCEAAQTNCCGLSDSSDNLCTLTKKNGQLKPCSDSLSPASLSDKSRRFVSWQWAGVKGCGKDDCDRNKIPQSFDEMLSRTRRYTLAVSGMAFQDAWNLDLDRLCECYIHVASPYAELIPFCAYNIIARDHPKTPIA